MLASDKEQSHQKTQAKTNKRNATHILAQLVELVDFCDPKVGAVEKYEQAQTGMLKDLSGSALVSSHYGTLVEGLCDDLLENADKKIDEIRQEGRRSKEAGQGSGQGWDVSVR